MQPPSWSDPYYVIPLTGMVLGNSLTGVSLGLERCLASFEEERDAIEARLTLLQHRSASSARVIRPSS